MATQWGRHTAAPNALKTVQFKETFADFHTLPTLYDTENCIHASAKARRRTFRHAAWLSVWWQSKLVYLSYFGVPTSSHLWRWRCRGPLHHLDRRVALRARGRLASTQGSSLPPLPAKQTMVVRHLHPPLWVRCADVDSTHQTLIDPQYFSGRLKDFIILLY